MSYDLNLHLRRIVRTCDTRGTVPSISHQHSFDSPLRTESISGRLLSIDPETMSASSESRGGAPGATLADVVPLRQEAKCVVSFDQHQTINDAMRVRKCNVFMMFSSRRQSLHQGDPM
jgi:hypothetical protein